jgi:uncharacterized protein
MKISMHALSVGQFAPMLGNLASLLDKAEASAAARKFEPAVLAADRLAPDMLPFTRQVQLACDFAKNSTARLAGQDAPKFADDETTFPELQARIRKTLDYLATVPPAAIDGSEDRDIVVPLRDRKLEYKGLPFLQKWVLPNFYFHVVTAYAILRHNGVDLGKRDYLGRD